MPYRHNQYQDDLEFNVNAKTTMSPSKAITIMAVVSAIIYFLI